MLDPRRCNRSAKQLASSQKQLPVPGAALSNVFKGKMVSALREASNNGHLNRITRPNEVDNTLNTLMNKDWVVYSRACLTKTNTIIDYLGRYSHRIAISDSRLLGIKAGQVLLKYKNYRDNKNKVMSVKPEELIRRFLLHVLPKGLTALLHPVTPALVHPCTS